ncbi:PREDICTED: microtubule-associated protein RP/EB family member 1-like isoform X2 [Wasmannia auropunctata]|uniref:microtubule-associated protein RP/EB family member 1-like isoform X2 n=1 Tax=Wasmannia auropunctata TaxID=64793 RepID=UPI0005F0358C|nr:PREDICTED: microtubule-associated protein RP/EB family member 1-like isoform X2 [Wasmannia auropunctata]
MVYESDFYTTRRPYSRPLVSSYSVPLYRPITIIPLSSVIQLRTVPHMPYVAHKRLVTIVHSPIHHVYYAGAMIPIRVRARVRPSILAAELNRIRDLPRPSSRSYIEDYLNSRYNILFDDETRDIRAKVDSLLRRVHVFVPRAVASDFIEDIIPERMRSHDYVRRLLTGRSNAKKQVDYLSWYEVPDRGSFGTLACIKYVAGKPQSVRKPYYKVADLRPADIRNDVNFLSYYSKNRQAAATASPGQPMTEREMRKVRALGYDSTAQEKKAPAPESETKPEKKAKKKPEPEEEPEPVHEPEPEPVREPEPIPEPEPVPEPAQEPEPEPIAEPVKPSKPAKASKSAKSARPAKTAASKAEPAPEPEPEPVKEPEVTKEPEPEPVQEPEPVMEAEPVSEPEPEAPAEPVAEAVSDEAEEEKVKQDREDAMRRAEAYLAKAAREAQSEEERRQAAEEDRLQLEMEERKAWEALQLAQERKAELSQILEIEQQEVERKAEEAKLQAEREEVERIEEGERLLNQAQLDALVQEQERQIIEEHLEEIQNQKQEQEEADVAQFAAGDNVDVSCAEDPAEFGEVTDQEKEEKPCDVITDDEARVEEENVHEEEPAEIAEDPFVEEPDGVKSKPQTGPMAEAEDGPQIEEVTSGEEFSWGDQDS